jgi:RNA polymerase sigma-70 factor (ECF subfamily)
MVEAREKTGSGRSALESQQDDDVSAERRAVDAALARIRALPPQQADVLLLRALGDLDVAEVAEITGEPLDLARVTEVEGLRSLKDLADHLDALAFDRAGPRMER